MMKKKETTLPLPPMLKKLKKKNPQEYLRLINTAKIGMDEKTWKIISKEYGL